MFVWVLLLRKLVATTLIGTYTPRVLVIDRYLYVLPSLQYGSCMQYCCIVCSCMGYKHQSVFLYESHALLTISSCWE